MAYKGFSRRQHILQRVTERQVKRAERSPQEQLNLLDKRLGVSRGAIKERARLKARP